jgi:hypothetical protein
LIWIMMDIKISMFATEFTMIWPRFCWFFCQWIHAEDGGDRKKRRNKNDYKQNAKYGDSKLCVQNNKNLSFTNEATNWD